MTLDALIMGLGVFVAVLPFLGFPIKWDTILMVVVGFIIVVLGIIVRRRGLGRRASQPRSGGSYVESSSSAADTHEAN
ncbi:MAG: hypothetical protein AAB605_04125 [Patescibacteria group bacterium]